MNNTEMKTVKKKVYVKMAKLPKLTYNHLKLLYKI